MGVNLLAECNGFGALGKHLRLRTAASSGKIRKKSIVPFKIILYFSISAMAIAHSESVCIQPNPLDGSNMAVNKSFF